MELAALIASIVSVILAGFAIWISITFYKMSIKVSEETREAAKNITSGVDRVEKLFDKLYTDTFVLMKETYTDMRRHIWPEKLTEDKIEDIEKKAEEKIKALERAVEESIKDTLTKQKIAVEKIDLITKELSEKVGETISMVRKDEVLARKSSIHEYILDYLHGEGGIARARDVVAKIANTTKFSAIEIINELRKLEAENFLTWGDSKLGPDSKILLKEPE